MAKVNVFLIIGGIILVIMIIQNIDPQEQAIGDVCSDTDGGTNFGTQGTLTRGTTIKVDSCTNVKTVLEYFCKTNGWSSTFHTCENSCEDGACVDEPIECVNSDGEAPESFLIKGITSNGIISREDICLSGDSLQEYFCGSSTNLGSQTLSCSERFGPNSDCEDGACTDCLTDADSNCDGSVSNTELVNYISRWTSNQVTNQELLEAIGAWMNS